MRPGEGGKYICPHCPAQFGLQAMRRHVEVCRNLPQEVRARRDARRLLRDVGRRKVGQGEPAGQEAGEGRAEEEQAHEGKAHRVRLRGKHSAVEHAQRMQAGQRGGQGQINVQGKEPGRQGPQRRIRRRPAQAGKGGPQEGGDTGRNGGCKRWLRLMRGGTLGGR